MHPSPDFIWNMNMIEPHWVTIDDLPKWAKQHADPGTASSLEKKHFISKLSICHPPSICIKGWQLILIKITVTVKIENKNHLVGQW